MTTTDEKTTDCGTVELVPFDCKKLSEIEKAEARFKKEMDGRDPEYGKMNFTDDQKVSVAIFNSPLPVIGYGQCIAWAKLDAIEKALKATMED